MIPLRFLRKVACIKTIKLELSTGPIGGILIHIICRAKIHTLQTGATEQIKQQKGEKTMTRLTAERRNVLSLRETDRVRWITTTALFMGMNIALCAFGIPVPGGHLYLNDVIICTAALLLDPVGAFIVGGIGAFLGDLIFYPLPMFVSLAAHGLQAAAVSFLFSRIFPRHPRTGAFISVLAGAVIMVTLYTLGKIYVYSTFEYAMLKLPYEIAQALLGIAGSLLLCFRGGLMDSFRKILRRE